MATSISTASSYVSIRMFGAIVKRQVAFDLLSIMDETIKNKICGYNHLPMCQESTGMSLGFDVFRSWVISHALVACACGFPHTRVLVHLHVCSWVEKRIRFPHRNRIGTFFDCVIPTITHPHLHPHPHPHPHLHRLV